MADDFLAPEGAWFPCRRKVQRVSMIFRGTAKLQKNLEWYQALEFTNMQNPLMPVKTFHSSERSVIAPLGWYVFSACFITFSVFRSFYTQTLSMAPEFRKYNFYGILGVRPRF